MATDLTTIFGSEIKVFPQPNTPSKQRSGIAGTHGMLSMFLGSRGRTIIVTGRIATTGANYAAARANCQAIIDDIESRTWLSADTYTFMGETYSNTEFDRIQLIPDRDGKVFHYNSEGYVFVDFICYLTQLI